MTEEMALTESLTTIGNKELLVARKTAVFCSRACPGEIILRVYDLARRLRDSDLTFIGGFHTSVEREFLHHLLGGSCRLIICPARNIDRMRLPPAWKNALDAKRILLLSPFTVESQRRQSVRLAERRNELVMTLADQILLLHAAPGSRTEHLARAVVQSGKEILTPALDDETLFGRLTTGVRTKD